jgi:hypothetical protein
MTSLSCSIINYLSNTSLDWGSFGVGFIFNRCNVAVESIIRGLQNLHPQFESGCRLLLLNPALCGVFVFLPILRTQSDFGEFDRQC